MTDLDDRIHLAISDKLHAHEEKIEALAGMMDILLRAVGLLDENGEWVDQADPGS